MSRTVDPRIRVLRPVPDPRIRVLAPPEDPRLVRSSSLRLDTRLHTPRPLADERIQTLGTTPTRIRTYSGEAAELCVEWEGPCERVTTTYPGADYGGAFVAFNNALFAALDGAGFLYVTFVDDGEVVVWRSDTTAGYANWTQAARIGGTVKARHPAIAAGDRGQVVVTPRACT